MNINHFEKALRTLEEVAVLCAENDNPKLQGIFEDSCVKRFEYTIATAINLMRKVLKEEYAKNEEDLTLNNIFRLMQSYGFITSWTSWRDYYKERNNTSHEYNLEKSKKLVEVTPAFINDCKIFLERLKKKFSQNRYFETLHEIFKDYPGEFFAYGSRVKGTFQPSSDLDVMVKGQIDPGTIQEIQARIDVSDLPFIVHLVRYDDLDQDFYKLIENDLKPL